jgi:hypothetical protein
VLSPTPCFFILTIPVQAPSLYHAIYLVCPMVINLPPSIPSTILGRNIGGFRDLINCTRCSILISQCQCMFDVCSGIGQDNRECGGLAWETETAFMSNERYVCPDPHGGSCGDTGCYYCACWSCVSWATLQRVGHSALHSEGTPRLVPLAIVTL